MDGEGRDRGRELECDCGYLAHGDDDDELVAVVQAHARNVHGMELSAELVLTLAGTNGAILAGTAPRHEPEEVRSPRTQRRLG
jgi:hypothetical protein